MSPGHEDEDVPHLHRYCLRCGRRLHASRSRESGHCGTCVREVGPKNQYMKRMSEVARY